MANKFTVTGIRKFNEEKVIDYTLTLLNNTVREEDVMRRYNEPVNNEVESYTLMIYGLSTQGVTIKRLVGGSIMVELPWLASKHDVRLCFAYLNAVKKVHRAARITEDDEKGAKLTDNDAYDEWQRRLKNMAEILDKGEETIITGVNRDFHLNPIQYQDKNLAKVFNDFVSLQWTGLNAVNVREEKRHIIEEEDLSTLRVIDNAQDVFVGACRFVGMMKGNTCKMVSFDDFCQLFKDVEEFRLMDAAQFFLGKIEEDEWNQLYNKAKGIIRENFRNTFIMRWNTDISNYKMSEFENAMKEFNDEGFYYDWSIWDHQKAHIGDLFYMIRTGNGNCGVVMRGSIIGTPYPDEDWSGKGRKVYYISMALSHMIHPDKSPQLLTTEELANEIPDYNWLDGHSGELLSDSQAAKLEELWHDFIQQVRKETSETTDCAEFNAAFKEKGWSAPEIWQTQNHLLKATFGMDGLTVVLAQMGQGPGYEIPS